MSCGSANIFGHPPVNMEIQKGDLLPLLRVQVLGDAKTPSDLSAATSVHFYMVHQELQTEVGGEMTVVNETTGECTYTWQSGDTDLPGIYIGRIVCTFAGNKKLTFPTCPEKGGLIIEVCDD